MIIVSTTFKNMVVKLVGECFVATHSYVIIHSVSKIYSFVTVCGITYYHVSLLNKRNKFSLVLKHVLLFSICYLLHYLIMN